MEQPTFTHRYTVKGQGPFPVDMLRRDNAKLVSQGDVCKLMEGSDYEPRVVHLVAHGKYDGWQPRAERWKSFGWRVDSHDVERENPPEWSVWFVQIEDDEEDSPNAARFAAGFFEAKSNAIATLRVERHAITVSSVDAEAVERVVAQINRSGVKATLTDLTGHPVNRGRL